MGHSRHKWLHGIRRYSHAVKRPRNSLVLPCKTVYILRPIWPAHVAGPFGRLSKEWTSIENYWTLLESEFDSGSTSHLFDTRDLTAWSQQYRDDKCTKQLYSVWIFPLNYKGIMNRHAHRIDQSTYVLTASWRDSACGVGGQCCWTLS